VSSTPIVSGLRRATFHPDQKARAQLALERQVFPFDEVTEVERRDSAEGTTFIVWTSRPLSAIPESVLGFPVTARVVEAVPELMI